VSREHCRIDVSAGGAATVTDLGSTNGTELDGDGLSPGTAVPVAPDQVVTLGGSVQLRVVPFMLTGPAVTVDPLREAGAAGTLPFSRAPRTALPPDPQPLAAPQQPSKRAGGTFSVASILGPLVMAGAMVAILHDIRFAAFALLSPVMVLGNWFETRTKGRRSLRRDLRDFSHELDELRASLTERRQAEIRRRRALLPDPAEVAFRAQAPSPWLWERHDRRHRHGHNEVSRFEHPVERDPGEPGERRHGQQRDRVGKAEPRRVLAGRWLAPTRAPRPGWGY